MNANTRGTSAPRRGAPGCEGLRPAPPRAIRGGIHRCRVTGREMTVRVVAREGAAVVVEVVGEIDVRTAGELRAILTGLAAEGHIKIVADFSGVRFCDASGLGALVAVGNQVAGLGGALRLVGVRAAQRRILRITGLEEMFRPSETIEEAPAS